MKPTQPGEKSDTPRMDATLGKGDDWVFAGGCKLERELAERDERVRRLKIDYAHLADQRDEQAEAQWEINGRDK